MEIVFVAIHVLYMHGSVEVKSTHRIRRVDSGTGLIRKVRTPDLL